MKIHRVVQIGLGARGETSLKSILRIPDRLELVGICDLNPQRLCEIGKKYKIGFKRCYTDAEEMLSDLRPEILSFCTLPSVRLELISLAIRYGVKGILFEKPMAVSLAEARKIKNLCADKCVKAAVCHQHKYLEGFRRLRARIDDGELGEIQRITAECSPWFSQLGTHYIDYVIWANGGIPPIAVVGHVHGRDLLNDSHPSADYMLGEMVFSNGVHASVEFGYMAKVHNPHKENYKKRNFSDLFWEDDRLTIYGTTGYAWAECNGRWGAFTKSTGGRVENGCGNGFHNEKYNPLAQVMFVTEFLDWLDGKAFACSCDVKLAYAGFETGVAMIQSALGHKRVDLPLPNDIGEDEIEWMKRLLPECERREFNFDGAGRRWK